MEIPKFTVVIPTFNEEKCLPKILNSIKEQNIQPEAIVIADRPGKDKTREIAESFKCKIVEGGIISFGRNNGYKNSNTPLVIFMDADVTFPNIDTLKKSIEFFLTHNLDYSNSLYYNDPDNTTFIAKMTVWGHNLRSAFNYLTVRLFRTNTAGSGAMIITKREVLDKIGGFSELYETNEDSEIINRVLKFRYKFGYIPVPVVLSGRRYKSWNFFKAVYFVLLQYILDFLRLFGMSSKRLYKQYMKIKGMN